MNIMNPIDELRENLSILMDENYRFKWNIYKYLGKLYYVFIIKK